MLEAEDTSQHYTIFPCALGNSVHLEENISSRSDSHWFTVSCAIANDRYFHKEYQLPIYYDTKREAICYETMNKIRKNRV